MPSMIELALDELNHVIGEYGEEFGEAYETPQPDLVKAAREEFARLTADLAVQRERNERLVEEMRKGALFDHGYTEGVHDAEEEAAKELAELHGVIAEARAYMNQDAEPATHRAQWPVYKILSKVAPANDAPPES